MHFIEKIILIIGLTAISSFTIADEHVKTIRVTQEHMQFCQSKAYYAITVIKNMDKINLEKELAMLKKDYEDLKKEGKAPPHFVYVDLQRMARGIYRMKKPIDKDKVFNKEFEQCIIRGF